VSRAVGRALAVAALCAGMTSWAAEPAVTRVPFVVGLTSVRAVSVPEGDYESVRVVTFSDASGYRIVVASEVPGTDGAKPRQLSVTRKVFAADQAGSRRMRNYFHSDDPDSFRGTVPGFSAAVVEDLRRTGRAQITLLDVGEEGTGSQVRREFSGTLERMSGTPSSVPMLVNGRLVALAVIRAQGSFAAGADRVRHEFTVLDDPANPMILAAKGAGTSTAIVRIEYPQAAAAPTSLESQLLKRETAQVYGIYFAFNRADLRPESARVLQEIATILTTHPDWKLRVDGHTDGIGGDAANLQLSRRRAAAVKAALVSGHGIDAARLSTDGHGEAQPQATNDTPEGRARNRRVELRRE
jgi:outer membrane protein OmpA-like peptidoglycan-associated protein